MLGLNHILIWIWSKKKSRTWCSKMIYLSWWMMQFLENVRKHREVKLIRTERRRNCLLSESNYHATTFFTENVSWIAMRKTQILISMSVYWDLSILDLSKTVMYEFWYDYVKLKYGENTKLCHIDTHSFIVHVKTDDINKDLTLQTLS